MTVRGSLRTLASKMGLHVTRLSQNPEHHWLGLGRFPIRTIIDVGANEGQFARLARARYPHARLYCFEPTPQAYGELKAWSKEDGNCVAVPIALGESRSVTKMHLHTSHTPSSSLLETTNASHALFPVTAAQQAIDVTVERMDDYFAGIAKPIDPDILVKLDVQGFEASVLRGATRLLAAARACIIEVCVESLYERQSTFAEVHELNLRAGLRFAGTLSQAYAPDGHVLYLDAVFVR